MLLFRNARSVNSTSSGLSSTNKISFIASAEREVEARAVIDFPFRPDLAAMAMHDPRYRRKADAGPWKLRHGVQSLKRAEELVRIVGVEAGSIVANIEGRRATSVSRLPYFNRRKIAPAGELPGILD